MLNNSLEMLKMVDWIPIVFITFKVLVLGTGMFFAIKWHYDKSKQVKGTRVVLRVGAIVSVVFVLLTIGIVFGTLAFARWLGMDLTLP